MGNFMDDLVVTEGKGCSLARIQRENLMQILYCFFPGSKECLSVQNGKTMYKYT